MTSEIDNVNAKSMDMSLRILNPGETWNEKDSFLLKDMTCLDRTVEELYGMSGGKELVIERDLWDQIMEESEREEVQQKKRKKNGKP